MTDPNSVRVELLLGELKEVVRLEPNNVTALCRIGRSLAGLGGARQASKCYRAAVDALRRAARSGDVQRALDFEEAIYTTFVKSVENEEHYRRSFADWKDDLATLGRRYRDPAALCSDGGDRIALFLHSGHILGHTEVLLKMLESRPRSGEHRVEARVYILHLYEPVFMARSRAAGIEVVSALDALGPGSTWDARFIWLRQRFRDDRVGVCVWVSVPTMAAFALSMRLAPVQIFWAMRFHPISGPDIDGHITWGDKSEKTRRYGNREWEVVPLPFAVDDSLPQAAEISELRRRFPESVLLGTLAREEKINSAPFLQAVADILLAHPQAGFLWTGRSEHPGIAGFFQAAGVGPRCHFVGWVDTKLYAAALDVFLETFPVGSGVTSYQAFAAGVPLLSYLHPQTIFGTHYWHSLAAPDASGAVPAQPRLSAPDKHSILCARDTEEYVALAGRLISDPAWRAQIGARGRAFFQEELGNTKAYAERFFATVFRIAASKLGGSARESSGPGPAT